MKNNDKKAIITAKVSNEAAEGWRSFCAKNGITVTALIEVAGLSLVSDSFPPKIEQRRELVLAARNVDMNRRSRRK